MKRLLLALVSGAVTLGCLWTAPRNAETTPPLVSSDVSMGEQLLHGVRESDSFAISGTMPLHTAWVASVHGHIPPKAWYALGQAAGAFPIAAAAGLGLLLGGPAAAAAAALLVRAAAPDASDYSQCVYTAFVALAAAGLVALARRPSFAGSLRAGVGLGASILFRSPLAFLPGLAALAGLWAGRGKPGKKARLASAAALVLAPALLLLPWIYANYRLHGRVIVFEYKRADMNIVLGALGLVPNADGDWHGLVGGIDTDSSGAVLRWAVKEVLNHPVRYAVSVVQRALYVASFHPFVFLLGWGALWLCRREPGFAALGFSCAYFLGIHCTMSIARHYMLPLWPLLAAAAGGGLARALRLKEPGVQPSERALDALVGLAAAACAWVLALVALYPTRAAARPGGLAAYAQALEAAPQDAWLRGKLGQGLLAAGRRAEAAEVFEKGLLYRPGSDTLKFSAAWARALDGKPESLLALSAGQSVEFTESVNLPFMQAWALLAQGRKAEARARAEAGLNLWRSTGLVVNRLETGLERDVLRSMRPSPGLAFMLRGLLSSLSVKERARFLATLEGWVEPRDHGTDLRLELLELAGEAGNAKEFARVLKSVNAVPLLPFDVSRRDTLVDRFGRPQQAQWPDAQPRPLDGGTLEKELARRPKDAGLWLELADSERRANRRDGAKRALERAQALAAKPEERRLLALRWQEWGDVAAAVSILQALERERPRDAGVLHDLGLALVVAGRPAEALPHLQSACGLEPSASAYALTLGAALERLGQGEKARAVYERALKRAAKGDPLRPMLEGALAAGKKAAP